MNVRKADSKGRLTGFEPGEIYAVDMTKGYVCKVRILAPDGRDVEEAIRDHVN